MAKLKDPKNYTPEETSAMQEVLRRFGSMEAYNEWWGAENDPSINNWTKALSRLNKNESTSDNSPNIDEQIKTFRETAEASIAASTANAKKLVEDIGRNPVVVEMESQSANHIPHTGHGNTAKSPNKPIINITSGMSLWEGPFGSYINQSNDCTGGHMSGHGAMGASHASAIDIVAGAGGPKARAWTHDGQRCVIDKDFIEDGARIYISHKTNLDSAFGLKAGGVGNWTNRSGIGIKADQVRVIAREGIKLVTKTDLSHSQGGDINSTYGIDLIAGNNDKNLQPMVLGVNLMFALTSIIEEMHKLAGIVDYMLHKQTDFNAALQQHDHKVPLPNAATLIAIPSPIVYDYGLDTMTKHFQTTKQDLVKLKLNLDRFLVEFLGQQSDTYICSRWNKVN